MPLENWGLLLWHVACKADLEGWSAKLSQNFYIYLAFLWCSLVVGVHTWFCLALGFFLLFCFGVAFEWLNCLLFNSWCLLLVLWILCKMATCLVVCILDSVRRMSYCMLEAVWIHWQDEVLNPFDGIKLVGDSVSEWWVLVILGHLKEDSQPSVALICLFTFFSQNRCGTQMTFSKLPLK